MKYFCIIGTYVSLIKIKYTEEFFNQKHHILFYSYYIILYNVKFIQIYSNEFD